LATGGIGPEKPVEAKQAATMPKIKPAFSRPQVPVNRLTGIQIPSTSTRNTFLDFLFSGKNPPSATLRRSMVAEKEGCQFYKSCPFSLDTARPWYLQIILPLK
jgi:hypothetical protein